MVLFLFTFIYQAAQTYVAVNERSQGYEEVKFAMERMIREIREASRITYPSAGARASRITVEISRPSSIETVDYRLFSNNIIRNDNKHPIVSHVSAFTVERTADSDPLYGSNKLTLWVTYPADDGQTLTSSMQVVLKNLPLPWPAMASYPPPKKRFQRDWWEIVEK